jgi:hypothetical protein
VVAAPANRAPQEVGKLTIANKKELRPLFFPIITRIPQPAYDQTQLAQVPFTPDPFFRPLFPAPFFRPFSGRKTRFQVRVRLSWAGLNTRRVSLKGFRVVSYISFSFPELSLAQSSFLFLTLFPFLPSAERLVISSIELS